MTDGGIRITGDFSLMYVPIAAGDVRRISRRWQSGLVFSPHGVSLYKSGGRVCRADETHAVFLPEGAAYTIECQSGDLCPLINFTCQNVPNELTELEVRNISALLGGFRDAERKCSSGNPDFIYSGLEYIYGIFAAVFCGAAERANESALFRRAADFIAENYSRAELSNDMIAVALNTSTVAFRTEFKRSCGIPPMRYVTRLRMERAKILLGEETVPIQEIAAEVGYSSVYSFSRTFKNICGCSPQQFRRSCRG